MRRMAQCRALNTDLSINDLLDFGANRDHGIDKSMDLIDVFRFSWLNHQGSSYRKGHRWRMEAVIHQTLCDVINCDTRILGQAADIKNALVGNSTIISGV